MVASIGVLVAAKPAHAATFTVNRTGDESERVANRGDGVCDALPSTAGNQCSLRAAIQEANANNNDATIVDLIRFNIVSSAAVKTISPSSPLPAITEALTINGYTQSGASANTQPTGNNAVLKIQLNGTNAGVSTNGLTVSASDSTIKGLVINRFGGGGIGIFGAVTGNKVQGNFIGTSANGNADLGNSFDGVQVSSASNNTVGGTAAGARNVISGNDRHGVFIFSDATDATGNKVLGNRIGTNAAGNQDLGNTENGVFITNVSFITSASNNTVGGTESGAGNVISGNDSSGVVILGRGTDNKVLGNRIGPKADGTGDLGNSGDGVLINARNTTVGGTESGASNVISGNGGDGVSIGNFSTATGIEVKGNVIRLNDEDGVFIAGDDNTIEGNLILANTDNGVEVSGFGRGNSILSNQIFGNSGLGIDLLGGTEDSFGVTANDDDDPDTGANNLQNFPVIASATTFSTGGTIISGTINSNPSQSWIIQCFIADGDPSNHGEGPILVAQTTANDDNGDGDASFTCVPSSQIAAGQKVTATATRLDTSTSPATPRDTSEFSENVVVNSGP